MKKLLFFGLLFCALSCSKDEKEKDPSGLIEYIVSADARIKSVTYMNEAGSLVTIHPTTNFWNTSYIGELGDDFYIKAELDFPERDFLIEVDFDPSKKGEAIMQMGYLKCISNQVDVCEISGKIKSLN